MTTIVDGTTGITFPSTISGVSATQQYSGRILQVVQGVKTDAFTRGASATWVSITGLSVSITPSSVSSRILIMATISFGTRGATDYDVGFALYKNGSVITGATGDASGSRKRVSFSGANRQDYELNNGVMNYIDSPASTSTQTYAVYGNYDGGTMYINRCYYDNDATGTERGISTITVMEIAA